MPGETPIYVFVIPLLSAVFALLILDIPRQYVYIITHTHTHARWHVIDGSLYSRVHPRVRERHDTWHVPGHCTICIAADTGNCERFFFLFTFQRPHNAIPRLHRGHTRRCVHLLRVHVHSIFTKAPSVKISDK